VRYQCTQRPEFNICQKCEEKEGENSAFSYIKIRKPEMSPVHIVCQYEQRPEQAVVELRHAPVAQKEEKKENMLMSKFESEDLDKSMFCGDKLPEVQVHPPTNVIAASELTNSTMEKVKFMERIDKLEGEQKKYESNMIQMMQMGFTEFDSCLASLISTDNDFEMATNSMLY